MLEFAVNGTLALPVESVVAVIVVRPPVKVPLGPLTGALKLMVAPGNGLLFASSNKTCNGDVKGLVIAALCGVPPVAVSVVGTAAEIASGRVTDVVSFVGEVESVTVM